MDSKEGAPIATEFAEAKGESLFVADQVPSAPLVPPVPPAAEKPALSLSRTITLTLILASSSFLNVSNPIAALCLDISDYQANDCPIGHRPPLHKHV
jgi:hypothetical protein